MWNCNLRKVTFNCGLFDLLQLIYSLQHYKGDERIKGFIWDLVTQSDSEDGDFRNHSGLSAPVPRGRKGKKAKEKAMGKQPEQSPFADEIAKLDFDPETILIDDGYKKHLQRHSNKSVFLQLYEICSVFVNSISVLN